MARQAWLAALCGLMGAGCTDCSVDIGTPIDSRCIFHDSLGHDIESDEGNLRADVACEVGVDCSSDRRSLLLGTKLEYKIVVPAEYELDHLRVASTDEGVLKATLERSEEDVCDGSTILHGTAEFHGIGEAALVVYEGDDEIDRYTTVTYEADHLELTAYQHDGSLESLSIAEPRLVRLSVVSEDGVRLVGGYDFEWEVGESSVAAIDDSTGPPMGLAILVPVAIGTTSLRVRSSGMMLDIPLEVTGVNLPDAGVDAAIDD